MADKNWYRKYRAAEDRAQAQPMPLDTRYRGERFTVEFPRKRYDDILDQQKGKGDNEEMTTKIFSVVMYWCYDDTEQGTYSVCVMAEDAKEAENLVALEMAALEEGSDNMEDFHLESITEGVNIWAAEDLLKALREQIEPRAKSWKVSDWDIRDENARAAIIKATEV